MPRSNLFKYLSSKEDSEAFLNGNMRFSSLVKFILTEDQTRKDIAEGYFDFDLHSKRMSESIIIGNLEKKDDITFLKNINFAKNPENFFVLCLSESDNLFSNFECDYCVCINNVPEFSKRLNNLISEILKTKDRLSEGKVKYYSSESRLKFGFMNGATPIHKNIKYELENEYRYFFWHSNPYKAMESKNGDCSVLNLMFQFEFNIGNLNDICEIKYKDRRNRVAGGI